MNKEKFYHMQNYAPEVLQGEIETQASDVWSVGIVLQELLTGAHPFKNCTYMS